MSKLTFDSVEDMIKSEEVQTVIDSLVTERDQQIDELNTKLKDFYIGRIVEVATKLNKPLVKKLVEAGDDAEAIQAARDELNEKLQARSLDSLEDTFNDFQVELDYAAESAAVDDQDPADQDLTDAQDRQLSDQDENPEDDTDTPDETPEGDEPTDEADPPAAVDGVENPETNPQDTNKNNRSNVRIHF